MPYMTSPRIPSYRLHKPTGLAVVRLNGQDVYLGKYGSPGSRTRYEQTIAQWLASNRQTPGTSVLGTQGTRTLSVNELFLAYWDFAKAYYVKNGKPTGEQSNMRDAARFLTLLFDNSPQVQSAKP